MNKKNNKSENINIIKLKKHQSFPQTIHNMWKTLLDKKGKDVH